MPTAAPARPLAPPVRRFGRGVLGSRLLEALAAPHGVDRYLELVRPSWSPAAKPGPRSSRSGAQTAGQRHADPAPERELDGLPRRAVRPPDGRDRRRAPHALLLARLLRAHRAPASIEITVKAHPEGRVSGFLNRGAASGHGGRSVRGRGRLRAAGGRAPRSLLLISGGSGITPVMSMLRTLCDEGHAGAVTFLHYAPHRATTSSTARELAEIAARHPNVRLVHAYTRERRRRAVRPPRPRAPARPSRPTRAQPRPTSAARRR